MKNQYVGDIGDYGKYSLLRAFIDSGVKIGVNWYLTPDDGTSDGKFTGYLEKGNMRHYDESIFDALIPIAEKGKAKSVSDIQQSDILPNAEYYSDIMNFNGTPSERVQQRKDWFKKSIKVLSKSELIFMDPDNGLLESDDAARRDAGKYILPSEAEEYFRKGHNVVYYCHKGRRTQEKWLSYKSIMGDTIKYARTIVLTFHKGTQRSYIFLIHDKSYFQYRKIIEKLLNIWKEIFTEEFTSRGTLTKNSDKTKIEVGCSDGSRITIKTDDCKWEKIYDDGILEYEGFVLNNGPHGMGVLYYKDLNPIHEGFFGSTGLLYGKEYYPNGQLRFRGRYKINKGYGPNYPEYGTWYSEDGEMIYRGSFSVKRLGLGWPNVTGPSEYGSAVLRRD